MERYKNLNGDSGVVAYEFGEDSITVRFDKGGVYIYNNFYTGSRNIEKMKQLALRGKGLCTFINKNVKYKYARKLR